MHFPRRAQVSLFVIAGLVLIVILALALLEVRNINGFFSKTQKERVVSYDYDQSSFESHISSCLSSSINEAVNQVASHAGYLSATPDPVYGESGSLGYVSLNGELIPVTLNSAGSSFLSDDEIEKRICRRTAVLLMSCFDTTSYADKGFDVAKQIFSSVDEVDAECLAILKPTSVVVVINYSASLSKNDFKYNTTSFSEEVTLPLKLLLDNARNLANQILDEENESVDISDVCSLSPDVSAMLESANVLRLEESVGFAAYGFFFRFGFNDFELSGSC